MSKIDWVYCDLGNNQVVRANKDYPPQISKDGRKTWNEIDVSFPAAAKDWPKRVLL